MKIDARNSIRIATYSGLRDVLKGLEKGTVLSASVIHREGKNDALLEINGRRIRAEFTGGAPGAGKKILLRLESAHGNAYLFRLIHDNPKNAFPGNIFEISIFQKDILDTVGRHGIFNLVKHFSNPGNTVFSINLFLHRMENKSETRSSIIGELMEKMIKKGVSKKSLSALSYLLLPESSCLIPLVSAFEDDFIFKEKKNNEDLRQIIEDIISEIDNILPESEKLELIESLLRHYVNYQGEKTGQGAGELPFFKNGMYRPIMYLYHGGSWLFSLDLSNLGTVDVLAATVQKKSAVKIYTYREDAFLSLKESLDELKSELRAKVPDINIELFQGNIIIDKMVEIYSHVDINSVFDIRV